MHASNPALPAPPYSFLHPASHAALVPVAGGISRSCIGEELNDDDAARVTDDAGVGSATGAPALEKFNEEDPVPGFSSGTDGLHAARSNPPAKSERDKERLTFHRGGEDVMFVGCLPGNLSESFPWEQDLHPIP